MLPHASWTRFRQLSFLVLFLTGTLLVLLSRSVGSGIYAERDSLLRHSHRSDQTLSIATSGLFLPDNNGTGLTQTFNYHATTGFSLRHAPAYTDNAATGTQKRLGHATHARPVPERFIDPYIRPELGVRMRVLRPVILEAAARHNQPALSGMNDTQFAEVIALLLYNEHNGWFEDEVEPLRMVTPFYQQAQVHANQSGLGSNFSIWPTNLRPSVALEILRQQVPVPAPTYTVTVPLRVAGSRIDPDAFVSQEALFAALTRELSQEHLAIEYLAANLERGLYRAQYENVPVSWRTLAAWHNQGIVHPDQIRADSLAYVYVRRTSAYIPAAHALIYTPDPRIAERRQR